MLDVPLFVSHRTLRRYKTMPARVAVGRWTPAASPSSTMHGGWRPRSRGVRRGRPALRQLRSAGSSGPPRWTGCASRSCSPRPASTVREHQERTVANYLELRDHGPFIPVLQGWTLDDYERCVTLYALAGVDLTEQPLVGVGSVCRRQDTDEIDVIFSELADAGIACHGFGVKKRGLTAYGGLLASADSMAWSYNARRSPPLPGCTHMNCANCALWALRWREGVA
jgi:hypothetical protein